MKEQEIEKLADEYDNFRQDSQMFDKQESYLNKIGFKAGFNKGYEAALSNPDYILIEKEYIVDNDILNDLFYEYSHSKTKQTFESFVVNQKGYTLIKKDILSNSKTK